MKIKLSIILVFCAFFSFGQVKISATTEVLNYTLSQAEIKISINTSEDLKGKKVVVTNLTDNEELTAGKLNGNKAELNGKITFPAKWNPHNWDSNQKTYELNIQVFDGDKVVAEDKLLHSFIEKELVEESDPIGTSHYFKINGRKCFVKGLLLNNSGVSAMRFENITIQDIKKWGFNLVRLPKLSIEKLDSIYTVCDKEGVMVWQDLTEDYFELTDLNSIKTDAEVYVNKLKNHPCLMAFCGYRKGFIEELAHHQKTDVKKLKKTTKTLLNIINSGWSDFEKHNIPFIKMDIPDYTTDNKGRKELKSIKEPSGRFNFIREGNDKSLKFIEYSRKSKPKTFGYIMEFIDMYSDFDDYIKAHKNFLIIPEIHENDIVFFVVNDSLKPLNAQIRVEAFTTKGEKINQKDTPVKLSNQLCNFGADIKKDFLKEKTKEDSYLVVSILDKGKVLSTRKVYWKNE